MRGSSHIGAISLYGSSEMAFVRAKLGFVLELLA